MTDKITSKPLDGYSASEVLDSDVFDFSETPSIKDVINNPDALASEIAHDLGINDSEMIGDIATLIKIQARNISDNTNIETFINHIIATLKEIANADNVLDKDELGTGVTQAQKEVVGLENTSKIYETMVNGLEGIADNGVIKNAKELSDVLGIDTELAQDIIDVTDGQVDDILELVTSA